MRGVPFGASLLNLKGVICMAWYLNKETGLKWEVTDKELIKRLSKDGNYEIVEEKKDNKSQSTKSKTITKK